MKNRVLIAYPTSELPFLPPLDEFLRLSGIAAGMPGLIRDLSSQLGKQPPSEKTLKSAFTRTVTRSTALRIQDIVTAKLPDPAKLDKLDEQLQPWKDLKLRSNGASWLPAITSLRDFCLEDRFPDARAEKFIHDRIEAEYEFLADIKHIALNPSDEQTDKSLKENAMRRLLFQHTFVDKELIEKACKVRMSDPERPRIENQFWQDVRIEFYYRLLSELSLDLLERFKEMGMGSEGQEEMISKGVMGVLAPKRRPDGRIHYPFAQLLERWKAVFSDSGGRPLTWRQLSRAIPHPNDKEMANLDPGSMEYRDLQEVAMQTRKTRLREWRGGVLPKDEQLVDFIENLLPEGKDGHYAWFVAHVSLSWGRLIDQEVARHEKGGLIYPINEGLLFRYHDIWEHYREQAARILAA